MSENSSLHGENLEKIINFCLSMGKLFLSKSNDNSEDKPFNIILAASHRYYWENFHSYIIWYILNHNKEEYTKLFIDYLNANLPVDKQIEINHGDYSNPIITRERNNIDILIKDNESKHCIIIENKINNADDRKRQLPNYYNTLVKQGYKVDKIVYLSLDGTKHPDKESWEDHQELKIVNDRLLTCAASNKHNDDLVNGFLSKCLLKAKTVQEYSFFNQYIGLLDYLRGNQMDPLMEEFYKRMTKNTEDYDTALRIKSMIDDLPRHRNKLIFEIFQNDHEPFINKRRYNTDWVLWYIQDIKEEISICIDSANAKITKMTFKIGKTIQYDLIKKTLETLGLLEEFPNCIKNDYSKDFSFPEDEKELIKFLRDFLHSLKEKKEKIKEIINNYKEP